MKIHLATDHAGLEHKNAVQTWLEAEQYETIDHGAYQYDALDDFPDFIAPAARAVSMDSEHARAIIFGGSGQGEAVMANRFLGVRAMVYYGGAVDLPQLSRAHNDANVISIGARYVSIDETKQVIWDWLQAEPLPDEKYHRRNKKIDQYTNAFYL